MKCFIFLNEWHGDILKPQTGVHGRLRCNQLWIKLARMLNSIPGGVEKPVDKWKKVWADYKMNTKKKYKMIEKRRLEANDNGPRNSLTELEQRVITLLGITTPADHVGIPQEIDISEQEPESAPFDPVAEELKEVHLIIEEEEAPHTDNDVVGASSRPTTPQQTTEDMQSDWRSPSRPETPTEQVERPQTTSIRSTSRSSRRSRSRARHNLNQPLFHLTAQEYVTLEQRRLQLEETREMHEHEREMERFRLESQRIGVAREHNQLLQQLAGIANKLVDSLNYQGRTKLML
ncbi:uncharacterized protein [Epargyreus clarus]|uniref:uncharacterized protein isoform X2 n=1 Tax=Epargyreus clarus TaxID=520877 RepID=UPI003C2D9FFC